MGWRRWGSMAGALWLAGAGSALAGPWSRAPGETYVRAALAAEWVEGLEARRYDLYAERGLAPGWTLTAKAERVTFAGQADFDRDGYRLTLRREIWSPGPARLALEGGVVGGGAIGGFGACADTGGEIRLSAGTSWTVKARDRFAFVDLVRREHPGACYRNRIEAGFGQSLGQSLGLRWSLVSQIWLERGSDDAVSDKVETLLQVDTRAGTVGLAWRQEFSGRFQERALVVSFSRTF